MKQKMIRLVVFDMAGTTVDEDNVVYKTLQAAVSNAGHPIDLDQVLLLGAGKEKRQAIVDILQHLGVTDEALADRIYKDFAERLQQAYDHLDVKPCPGAETVFATLRQHGIKVALNTGYNNRIATSLLDKLGWTSGDRYDLLVNADHVERGRPHPDMIHLAMKNLGITDPKQVAKIGDSGVDIEEGKNAGCGLTFGITTGAQTKEQLEKSGPDRVLQELTQLIPLVVG